MRLRTYPRAERLLGRIPRLTAYSAIELLLLALIAVQAARLAWILVTPVGPVGEYRAPGRLSLTGSGAALGDFDPFFRLEGGGGPAVVTALNLKLHGVREDRATGQGSAIIALPDGTQLSFGIGEEIMPGVTLASVGFDSVTINRNGTPEQIFLDQSQPAVSAGATPAPGAVSGVPPTPAAMTVAPAAPATVPAAPPFRFQPRMSSGQIDGIVVQPGADGGRALRGTGLEAGDVIVSINGQRVTSVEQVRAELGRAGGSATVVVDRGGRAVPVPVRLGQ
ncbi:MAG: type II secretion system protein N [Allosphingosinicella sp.]